jgi:hypothetical protein
MKKIQTVVLALVAVFAFSAFSASSAFALESVWLVAGAKPTAQVPVDSEGTLKLTDMKGGILGESVTIECTGTDKGFVGPGKEDLLEVVVVTACKTTEGTCGSPKAEAENLSWLTTIELIGTSFYDDIVTEATGQTEFGYVVECTNIIKVSDRCLLVLGRALLTNETNGTVDATFNSTDANQPAANCERGGAGEGLVNGLDTILTVSGQSLAVSEG